MTILRAVRTWRGMSQVELAERAGLHRAQVIRLEHGQSLTRAKTLKRLAKALSVPPELLLGELWIDMGAGVRVRRVAGSQEDVMGIAR